MGNKNKHKKKVSIFDDEFEEELDELEKSDEIDEVDEMEEKPKYESSKESKKEDKHKKEDKKLEDEDEFLEEDSNDDKSEKDELDDDDIDFDDLWVKKDKKESKESKKSDDWKRKKEDKDSKRDEEDDDEDLWESKSKKDKSKKVIVPIDKDEDEEDWKDKKEEKGSKKKDEEDDDDSWERKSSKKEDKREEKKKDLVVGKDTKKDKEDEEDDDDDEEETSSIGIKIVLGIIILAIIIVLLLKSCNDPRGEFTVTFDTNGGTRIADVMVTEDGKLQKPVEPTKDGYEFAGWYYNDELYDFDKPVTGDIELEARWVEAENVSVTGVELDQTTIKLSPGGTATLVATVTPANAKDKSLTWESSNPEIVTVDGEGNITAVKAGTAKITVKTTDGEFTATTTVTVSKDVVAATGVTLNQTTLTVGPNATATLKATVNPSNASNKGVTWTSSDTSVATVSSTGVVTGKKDGTAVITVTTKDGGYKAVCNVTVKTVKVTGVKATNDTATVKVGKTATLKATVAPSNATNKKVTWTSDNTDVVKVSASGVITGVSEGTATVTVTTVDGSFTDTIEVTVKPLVLAESVTISGKTSVQEGKTITLDAKVSPSDTDDKSVTWESSDKSIATVSSKGVVKGVKAGKVTITAKTSNGKTATYEVTVTEKPANYAIKFTANYTGTEISGWSFTVTKDKKSFTDFGKVSCGKTTFHKESIQAPRDADRTSTCTITLSSGTPVTASATWKS